MFKDEDLSKLNNSFIDASVFRYLKTSIDSGAFDNKINGKLDANVTSEEHKAISQRLAEEGFVLLKNDENALPLKQPSKGQNNLLIIGDAAHHGVTHFNGNSHSQNTHLSQPFGLLCEKMQLPKLSEQTLAEKVKVCNRTNKNCILAGGKLNDIKESRVV